MCARWIVKVARIGRPKDGWDYAQDFFPREVPEKREAELVAATAHAKGGRGISLTRIKEGD